MKTLYTFVAAAILLAAGSLFPTTSIAQPGTLDLSFGTGGKVTTAIGTGTDEAYSAVLQTDGKIVVAGYSYNGVDNDFAVVRYNTNGTLDNTFGTGGKATAAIGTTNDVGYGVALQSNGKIVMAGQVQNGTYPDFGVARFTTAGILDNTFGTGGKVITSVGTTDIANAVAIQSDGKIVVAGETQSGVSYDFAVVRYDTTGTLDNTFGSAGKVITPIGTSTDIGYAIAIQTDGKIVVGGTSVIGTGQDFALVRYKTNGNLDSTFGTNGIVTTDFGSPNDLCYSIAIQSNGKIVAGGYTYNGTNNDFAIARYNSDGTLDNTFGTGGKVTTPIGTRADVGYGVAIQSDGKILMTGSSDNGTYIDLAVVRYTSTGTLDNGFGTGGKVTTPIGAGNSYGRSIVIQTDGRPVVAGYSGSNIDFTVVRYNGGTVDINEISSGNLLSVFPNPFENELKISCNSSDCGNSGEVILYDITGKEILRQKTFEGETKLSTSHLASGFYLLNYTEDNKSQKMKVVKGYE